MDFKRHYFLRFFFFMIFLIGISSFYTYAQERNGQIEKQVLKAIVSETFDTFATDRRCMKKDQYTVILIDNFDQALTLIPEVKTTHGGMVEALLKSGRNDIQVHSMNTALSKGLAEVIDQVMKGRCIDLVLSSTPGSNYTYGQIGSLLGAKVTLNDNNILAYKDEIKQLIRQIAIQGFPSVQWLEALDVNSIKLKNDAVKYMFIEALGRMGIPVILPYGNNDTRHKGQIKSINLLSFSENANVYSALDQTGKRISDFPYSPISSGDAQAVYTIIECPVSGDPTRAKIDINNDGFYDYVYPRQFRIPYDDLKGDLKYAPMFPSETDFRSMVRGLEKGNTLLRLNSEIVLTRSQFLKIQKHDPSLTSIRVTKSYVWLNSKAYGRWFEFDPVCQKRGVIHGTSVIPPHKAKEWLP